MSTRQSTGLRDVERPAEETQQTEGLNTGQVLLAYDGSAAAEHALSQTARLLAERRALVLVVWKSGLRLQLLEISAVPSLPPAAIDIRTEHEIDQSMYERARRLAGKGAGVARDAGLDAEGLVVAEDAEIPISETIVRIARERGSPAVVVGERAQGQAEEVFLGRTSRDVICHAPCPVVVVRFAQRPQG